MFQGNQAGDWECLDILGKGSYGIVGLWKNRQSEELMAVKKFEVRTIPPPSPKVLADLQERYKKEVSMMYEKIDNGHVVATKPAPPELASRICGSRSSLVDESNRDSRYEPVQPPGVIIDLPLLCMEFCSGGDLRRLLKRPENLSGLPEVEVRAVLAHISDAISYLHDKKIIHRDIKPENIVIQKDASGKAIYKLSDLGFAKDVSSSESFCSTFLGTLPYLAPEIYIEHQRPGNPSFYDKAVDYWSFGLIAFEIVTGNRPFMPGESPAVWIPAVSTKAKDVIAIYKNDEGKVVHSRDIPYTTHLSDLFRKCIVAWLPSMLQYDPAKRGKYVLSSEEKKAGSGDVNALTRLQNLLKTKFLEIRTSTERLVYAVGRSTRMLEVQKWVERDTKFQENYIILTKDGVAAQGEDLASIYLQSPLYFIPKGGEQINLKLVLPQSLTAFLNNYEAPTNPTHSRKIWITAIYYIQGQLERALTLWHATQALRKYHSRSCTEELRTTQIEISKREFSLDNLIELDENLEDTELSYREKTRIDFLESISSLKEEGEKLKAYYNEAFTPSFLYEDLALKFTSVTDLEAVYGKILAAYDNWRQNGGSMEYLVRLICNFSKTQHTISTELSENRKILLEQLGKDEEKKQKIQIILSKFNGLIDQVMIRRLKKQKLILESAFPSPKPDIPVNRMTQSLIQNGNETNGSSPPSLPKKMSQSFTAGSSSRRSSFSPDFMALLEETQSIQEELDTSISDAVAHVQALKEEKAKRDLSFL